MSTKHEKSSLRGEESVDKKSSSIKMYGGKREGTGNIDGGEKRVLNDKQLAFAREYVIDFNATQAAIRAGYSRKTAGVQCARLLGNVSIQAEIRKRMDRLEEKAEVKALEVLEGLKRVAFADPRKLFVKGGGMVAIKDLDDATALAIAGIEVAALFEGKGKKRVQIGYTKKIKFNDRISALLKLGEHISLFKNVQEREHKNYWEGVDVRKLPYDILVRVASGDITALKDYHNN